MKVNLLSLLCLLSIVSLTEITNDTLNFYKTSYENSIFQTKMVSCLSLVHLSIAGDNKDFQEKISNTQLDRTKFYYKYIMKMMTNCLNHITKDFIDIIISPEHHDINKMPLGIQELIEVKEEITDVELNEEEQSIMNEIKVVEERNQKEQSKKKKKNENFFDRNYMKILIGCLVLMGFVIYINFKGMNKEKKPSDNKDFEIIKEIMEAKQKNKPKSD